MDSGLYEFHISKTETNRRLTAFATFIICLFSGLIFGSLFTSLRMSGNILLLVIFFTFIFLFLVFWILIFRFFKTYHKTKIILTEHYIKRSSFQSHEKFLFKDVKEIHVKRTTGGSIREIKFTFINNKNLFLDGIDQFEKFKNLLMKRCQITNFKESREWIDYDHPLFYVVLGFLLGIVTVFVINFMTGLNYAETKILFTLSAAYVSLVGGYFIFNKPLAKRYGKKLNLADLICGSLMIATGIIIEVLA